MERRMILLGLICSLIPYTMTVTNAIDKQIIGAVLWGIICVLTVVYWILELDEFDKVNDETDRSNAKKNQAKLTFLRKFDEFDEEVIDKVEKSLYRKDEQQDV